MEFVILLVCLLILAETSFLLAKKFKPFKSDKRKIYVDTSALIDGRIVNLAKTGFVTGDFIILKDVLLELQLLADSKDQLKRTRARAGLNAVSELERVIDVNTEIESFKTDTKKVDEILLEVAKENDGELLTMDYNLMKVAEAEGIKVLNINILALAVRTEYLVGERMKIIITEKGSNPKQGVGHTQDGVMVVVDNASRQVGKEVEVEFVRFHETPTGKMIFAKLVK